MPDNRHIELIARAENFLKREKDLPAPLLIHYEDMSYINIADLVTDLKHALETLTKEK